MLEEHVDDAWNHAHMGGPCQLPVLEQGGQIALGDEVACAAGNEGRQQSYPARKVVER
ncbi:Uncharacterised protein [Mycobacteroides abscessus subsp. abscessus]|nr:Uncharacterised protein [Mycobacteroides abscessus subsp. abscessus]SLC91626.1 Uncharacterised protein [Mycobacteroides abscessus subsp. massiliense]